MKKISILLVMLVVMLTACGTPATKPEDMNDADRFENYVDVQTNQSLPLPTPY